MQAVSERKETDKTFQVIFYAEAPLRLPHDVDPYDFIASNWVTLQDEAVANMRVYCDFDLFEIG